MFRGKAVSAVACGEAHTVAVAGDAPAGLVVYICTPVCAIKPNLVVLVQMVAHMPQPVTNTSPATA